MKMLDISVYKVIHISQHVYIKWKYVTFDFDL